MNTQITLNENKEVEMLILPTKDNKIFKKYRCYAYSSRIDLIFIGIYCDNTFTPIEELRTIYTTTNDLKKAIKQDLLKVYNTIDDLKSAYLNAGGSLGWWEHDITKSRKDFKAQAQMTALRTISGLIAYEKAQAEQRRTSSALNASENTLIDAYTFTLLTYEEQREAIKKSLIADDYKQEGAHRLLGHLRDAYINVYNKCDYIKTLLSIQGIMQYAYKAGYKTLIVKLRNGTYQEVDIKTNRYLGRCWCAEYRQNIDSIFYGADIKLKEIEQIIYKNMILWEVK